MKIAGLQKLTLIDYPDTIACSVFLAGCNLDCGFCHNRWMINAETAPEAISVSGFLAWLETRKHLLKGVCISGGEPTINTDLAEFMEQIREMGLQIKLDTNGVLPRHLETLLDAGLVDYVAMDIKAPLDARYDISSGRNGVAGQVRKSIQVLREWRRESRAAAYEFRTTVEPRLCAADLTDIAVELLPDETWYLQAFKAAEGIDPELLNAKAMTDDDLAALVPDLVAAAPGVRVRAI